MVVLERYIAALRIAQDVAFFQSLPSRAVNAPERSMSSRLQNQ
jgi:hypothetical protein